MPNKKGYTVDYLKYKSTYDSKDGVKREVIVYVDKECKDKNAQISSILMGLTGYFKAKRTNAEVKVSGINHSIRYVDHNSKLMAKGVK